MEDDVNEESGMLPPAPNPSGALQTKTHSSREVYNSGEGGGSVSGRDVQLVPLGLLQSYDCSNLRLILDKIDIDRS